MSGNGVTAAAMRYCASPFIPGDDKRIRALMGEYGRALVRLALEQTIAIRPMMSGAGTRLKLPRFPWPAAWDPTIAELERALMAARPPEDIWDCTVPLLLNLGVAGAIDRGDLRLTEPRALWWGSVRLPIGDRVMFRRNSQAVRVQVWRRGRRMANELLRQSDEGIWTARSLSVADVVRLGRYPILVRTGRRGDEELPLPAGQRVRTRLPQHTDRAFAEVTRLLRLVRPTLPRWVSQAIRIVVPLQSIDGTRISASVEEFPGVTFLSLPLEPADIAARLVHEASHHYYLALQRLSALDDGSDSAEYHSPIKERGRTIDMILFAFHAFGNGALFHRDLARRDAQFEQIAGSTLSTEILPLRIMHDYLRRTTALTAAGRALWRPVADRLFR